MKPLLTSLFLAFSIPAAARPVPAKAPTAAPVDGAGAWRTAARSDDAPAQGEQMGIPDDWVLPRGAKEPWGVPTQDLKAARAAGPSALPRAEAVRGARGEQRQEDRPRAIEKAVSELAALGFAGLPQ